MRRCACFWQQRTCTARSSLLSIQKDTHRQAKPSNFWEALGTLALRLAFTFFGNNDLAAEPELANHSVIEQTVIPHGMVETDLPQSLRSALQCTMALSAPVPEILCGGLQSQQGFHALVELSLGETLLEVGQHREAEGHVRVLEV